LSASASAAFDAAALARPGVREMVPYQPGKPIEELERELGIANAVKLASNENPLGPSPLALAALRAAGMETARYPDANGYALKKALGGRLGVAMERIVLGNGSNDVLDLVARVFAGPGDEVLFSQHAFLVYPLVARAVGATPVEVPACNWGHDLEAMARAVTPRTRVVYVANPNNPTGTYCPRDELRAFLDGLPATTVCVVDEAYFEYVAAEDYPDCLPWLERYPNLVVTRTFSKIYGLAGLRIGYAVASPAICDFLNRVRQPFNTSLVAQEAALAALEDEDHVRRSRERNAAELLRLEQGMRSLGLDFISSVANFLTVGLGRPADPVYQAMLRQGVIVRPIANYGMPNHLRFTVGHAEDNDRALAALRRALA
jgi:histidinol-phosphate aminotransferase